MTKKHRPNKAMNVIQKLILIEYIFNHFDGAGWTEDFLSEDQDRYMLMKMSGMLSYIDYRVYVHDNGRNENIYKVEVILIV